MRTSPQTGLDFGSCQNAILSYTYLGRSPRSFVATLLVGPVASTLNCDLSWGAGGPNLSSAFQITP
jgi:hypothetical protein